MKHGRDATRRNRNIGTSRQGHGRDNRMVVPEEFSARYPYEPNLDAAILVQGHGLADVRIYVDPVAPGYAHHCTPSEIVAVLSELPREFISPLHVVLHQPTHKQRTLRPTWGRMLYSEEIRGEIAPVVFVSAQNPQRVLRWSKRLGPQDMLELERLREDGHSIRQTRRHWEISPSAASIRHTQLMRALPHEIGHLADYETFVHGERQPESMKRGEHELESTKEEDDWDWDWDRMRRASELYFARPSSEREAFAHRFAQEYRTHIEVALALSPTLHGPDPLVESSPGVEPSWFASLGAKR